MRKLKLEIEQLTVTSFATAPAEATLGTVRGAGSFEEDVQEPVPSEDPALLSLLTCFTNCNQLTCNLSCAGTCYYDRTCNSCNVTLCPTGRSPECCAIV